LVRMLAEREDPTVIQSWLTGLNPELGDRVPLRVMRENDWRPSRRSWEPRVLSLSAVRSELSGSLIEAAPKAAFPRRQGGCLGGS
jgi:hypothetical protein